MTRILLPNRERIDLIFDTLSNILDLGMTTMKLGTFSGLF